MDKLYDYFINKVFTVPYIDKMISGKRVKIYFFNVSADTSKKMKILLMGKP